MQKSWHTPAIASSYAITAIVGPKVMSETFGHFTDKTGYYFPGAPFIGAAMLIFICLLIFLLARRVLR